MEMFLEWKKLLGSEFKAEKFRQFLIYSLSHRKVKYGQSWHGSFEFPSNKAKHFVTQNRCDCERILPTFFTAAWRWRPPMSSSFAPFMIDLSRVTSSLVTSAIANHGCPLWIMAGLNATLRLMSSTLFSSRALSSHFAGHSRKVVSLILNLPIMWPKKFNHSLTFNGSMIIIAVFISSRYFISCLA